MSGLSANVSLGQPVISVPGATGGVPGPDDMSFRDAFQEAKATRPSTQTHGQPPETVATASETGSGSQMWTRAGNASALLSDQSDSEHAGVTESSGPSRAGGGRERTHEAHPAVGSKAEADPQPPLADSSAGDPGSFEAALVAANAQNSAGVVASGNDGQPAATGDSTVGAVGATGAVSSAAAANSAVSVSSNASANSVVPAAAPDAAPLGGNSASSGNSAASGSRVGRTGKTAAGVPVGSEPGTQESSRNSGPAAASVQPRVGSASPGLPSTPAAAQGGAVAPPSASTEATVQSTPDAAADPAASADAGGSPARVIRAASAGSPESAVREFVRTVGRDSQSPSAPNAGSYSRVAPAAPSAPEPAIPATESGAVQTSAASSGPNRASPASTGTAASSDAAPQVSAEGSPASVDSAIRAFLKAAGRLTDATPRPASGQSHPAADAAIAKSGQTTALPPSGGQDSTAATTAAPTAATTAAPTPTPDDAAANAAVVTASASAGATAAPRSTFAARSGTRLAGGFAQPRFGSADRVAPSQGKLASATESDVPATDPAAADRASSASSWADASVAQVQGQAIGAAPDVASLVAQVAAAPATPAAGSAHLTQGLAGPHPASQDVADSADRLMNQVIKTIHTYQTSAGPSLEARVSDPVLGDVKVIVTGQAGEIVQAQLVVRDRATADALLTATARSQASGEALSGVNVSVRSESGGSWTSNGRSGGSAADSTGWGQAAGSHAGPGDGSAGRGSDAAGLAGGGHGTGSGPSANGSHGSGQTPTTAPRHTPAPVRQPNTRLSRSGGSSLDVRA
jgi:hypothetical protein